MTKCWKLCASWPQADAMADPNQASIFLERRSYRRRRMVDAVKMMPIAAAWAFMLPLLWSTRPTPDGEGVSLSFALIFIFGAWLTLTLASAALAAILKPESGQEGGSSEDSQGGGS